MGILEVLLCGIGLSMDAFAVSLGAGTLKSGRSWRLRLRMAGAFGLFQAVMPILGWALGNAFVQYIKQFDHWIAFGLLAYIGGKMIYEGIRGGNEDTPKENLFAYSKVGILAIATSIDALAVGLSFAMVDMSIWGPAAIIGCITFTLSLIALLIGGKLGEKFGERMEILGGLVLVGIGLKILCEHLFFA